MRMWMVDPKVLCRAHLLGEHSEIHKHRHNFVKRHNLEGRKTQIEPRSMQTRHDALVEEMVARGYQHNSPYEQPDTSHLTDFPDINKDVSLALLLSRCALCRARKDLL